MASPTDLSPLAEELASGFRRAHPDVVVLVDRVETSEAARARARAGRADVVIAAGGPGRRLGWRALCLAADPAVGVVGLTRSELARIYRQEATLWSDLGPYGQRPVTPVDRGVADPDHLAFDRAVLGAPAAPVGNALLVADDAGAAAALRRPGTVAYVGLRSQAGAPVSLDGVACTPSAVRSGEWPLSRELLAWAAGGSGSRYPSDFVSFALSAAGQEIVDRHQVGA